MIRDRIVELRRVRASELVAHPFNWRTHPQEQRDALRGVLAEIGLADAVVARELPDGHLQLIDGHLRAEIVTDDTLPVLVVDLNDDEANELLLSHDAITGLAGVDSQNLTLLLAEVKTSDDALCTLFANLASHLTRDSTDDIASRPVVHVPQLWHVVVECEDESQQRDVYEQLVADGRKCRLLVL